MEMKKRGLAYLTAILAAIVTLVFTGCPEGAPIYVYVYSVTVQQEIANGSISASPTSSAPGKVITLTITPHSGYFLSSLNVRQIDGTAVPVNGSGETRTFTMPPSHVTVSGEFGNRYSVTVQAGIENGTINPSPTSSVAGNTITLTIIPNTGYILKENSLSVKQTDGTVVPISDSDETYTFTMPASHVTVSGEFEKEIYSVTVQEGIENGTISASVARATMDEVITLTITSVGNYILKESSLIVETEDGTPVLVSGSGDIRTFSMPASHVTISGEFGIQCKIDVQEELENGSISASVKISAPGDTITLTITPDPEFILKESSLSVETEDGLPVLVSGSGRTRTFTMPASHVTVSGEFEEIATSQNNTINIHFEGFYDEDIDLTSDYENDLVLGSGQELNVSVPEGYDKYYWYVNGEPWSGLHFFTLTMDADIWKTSTIGVHTITVVIQKGEIFYSKNLTFRVVW
jgi:uncharacterized OsmC-like protein